MSDPDRTLSTAVQQAIVGGHHEERDDSRRGWWGRTGAEPPSPAWAIAAVAVVLALLAGAGTASADSPQQIASDAYTNTTSQHQTAVEPAMFAFGTTVVSAFQLGRFFDGGSSNIGWATSTDGGVTWTNGTLPSLTSFSAPAGSAGRATDPSVAYDSAHGVWIISSLTLTAGGTVVAIVVSRSVDGLNWAAPVTVAASSAYDKEWVVCDNGGASPFAGHCYVSWDDAVSGPLLTSTSTDGGVNWGPSIQSADSATGVGAQPLVQPNGTLIIAALGNGIIAIRSTNGGASFGPTATVSTVTAEAPTAMRAPPLPSAQIDAAGRVYVAWHDCRFRAGCSANDIVTSSSSDGISWSPVMRVPIDDVSSGANHFIPGLAVNDQTSGAATRIGLAYYYFPVASCAAAACQLNIGFISSNDGGVTWGTPKQLNPTPMAIAWLANTNQGRMVGDYVSASFTNGAVVTVFALASAPNGSLLHEAIDADREVGPLSVGGVAEEPDSIRGTATARPSSAPSLALCAAVAGAIVLAFVAVGDRIRTRDLLTPHHVIGTPWASIGQPEVVVGVELCGEGQHRRTVSAGERGSH